MQTNFKSVLELLKSVLKDGINSNQAGIPAWLLLIPSFKTDFKSSNTDLKFVCIVFFKILLLLLLESYQVVIYCSSEVLLAENKLKYLIGIASLTLYPKNRLTDGATTAHRHHLFQQAVDVYPAPR